MTQNNVPLLIAICVVICIGVLNLAYFCSPHTKISEDLPRQKRGQAVAEGVTGKRERSSPSEDLQDVVSRHAEQDEFFFVTIEAINRATGAGLAQVRVCLRKIPSFEAVAQSETGPDGNVRIECLPEGRYFVELEHDTFLPCKLSSGRSQVASVPGPPITSEWLEAYSYGVELRGDVVDVRIEAGPRAVRLNRAYSEIRDAYANAVQRLRDKFVKTPNHIVSVIVPEGDNLPGTIGLTAFSISRGPCYLNVPLVRVNELSELTVIDSRRFPVIEPMGSVTISVQDAGGREVDIGDFTLVRASLVAYHGWLTAECPSNGIVHLPPGDYDLLTCALVERVPSRPVSVRSGILTSVAYRLDAKFVSVEIQVRGDDGGELPRPAYLSRVVDRSSEGEPICGQRLRCESGTLRLELPEGRSQFIVTYFDRTLSLVEHTVDLILDELKCTKVVCLEVPIQE